MRLSDSVATAVADSRAPTAALALVYAERIDEATHAPLGLAAALDTLRDAAQLADEQNMTDGINATHMHAWRKVAAAVSAVTVAGDLGPKLLAALDALLLTPKAQAAIRDKLPTAHPTSPIEALRNEEDEFTRRRRERAGA